MKRGIGVLEYWEYWAERKIEVSCLPAPVPTLGSIPAGGPNNPVFPLEVVTTMWLEMHPHNSAAFALRKSTKTP